MIPKFSNNSIYDKDYDYFSTKNFFGGNDDLTRLIIMVFILVSFILNIIIIYVLSFYKNKRDFSLSGLLTLNLLVVNFLHILTYIFDWVIKNDEIKNERELISPDLEIGALLKGNPSSLGFCKFQGFFLIFLSLSQDIIVIIFFAFIKIEGKGKKYLASIILIFSGYIFPLCITLIFLHFDIIGINEKFCYISKYSFDIDDKHNIVSYEEEEHYKSYKGIIFAIRSFSFIIIILFIIRACRYTKRSEKSDKINQKLKNSLPIFLISFFTLCVDIIFKSMSLIDEDLEEKYIEIYIIANSVDSILLPLAFSIEHKIYIYICCCCKTRNYEFYSSNENELSIKDPDIDQLIPENKNNPKEMTDQ